MTTVKPYGSWPSPISAHLLAAGSVGLSGPAVRGTEIWWSELRPADGGRNVPVSAKLPVSAAAAESSPASASPRDRLASPWSARTRVHEYGGGAWWLGKEHFYFASWADQRLYRVSLNENDQKDDEQKQEPVALTPEPETKAALRYAHGHEHPSGKYLVCVRESHKADSQVLNELVFVQTDPASGVEPVVVVTGADFVSSPRFSPDGKLLSWIEWDHPQMPWDHTRLKVASVSDNVSLSGTPTVIAGVDVPQSVVGAGWTSDGSLVFSSDKSGWWNMYRWTPNKIEALTAFVGSEIGSPPWKFGMGKRWCELPDGRLAVAITEKATDRLAIVDTKNPEKNPIGVPVPAGRLVSIGSLAPLPGAHSGEGGRLAVVGSGVRRAPEVALIGVEDGNIEVIRAAEDIGVDETWFSEAQAISFESGKGENKRTAHAFFYPPSAPDITALAGTLPPLVVMGHGGPTSHSDPGLKLKIQYWTTRGFAVADVNYGGSTGFGRDYKNLLQKNWGIVDVEDCISVVKHLVDAGKVDAKRVAIRGGSAGGFTVLAALEASADTFGAGCSMYGVADLTALAADTHKFESRYLDGLIGAYPKDKDIYEERSPINHTDKLNSPLLVLQGLEDKIVPPNQSEAIVKAVAEKGLPHAYVAFEGEQHGFRKAENIVRAFEVELWFYGKVFGFEPADKIEAPEGAVGFD